MNKGVGPNGSKEAGPSGSKDPGKQQGQNYDLVQYSNHVQHYISVISEAFYMLDDDVAWWVNSGAAGHVCKDLRWFKDCQLIEDGTFVKMGNIATEPIRGLGCILLYFTSGKSVFTISINLTHFYVKFLFKIVRIQC